jgi:hypothetical protein
MLGGLAPGSVELPTKLLAAGTLCRCCCFNNNADMDEQGMFFNLSQKCLIVAKLDMVASTPLTAQPYVPTGAMLVMAEAQASAPAAGRAAVATASTESDTAKAAVPGSTPAAAAAATALAAAVLMVSGVPDSVA